MAGQGQLIYHFPRTAMQAELTRWPFLNCSGVLDLGSSTPMRTFSNNIFRTHKSQELGLTKKTRLKLLLTWTFSVFLFSLRSLKPLLLFFLILPLLCSSRSPFSFHLWFRRIGWNWSGPMRASGANGPFRLMHQFYNSGDWHSNVPFLNLTSKTRVIPQTFNAFQRVYGWCSLVQG